MWFHISYILGKEQTKKSPKKIDMADSLIELSIKAQEQYSKIKQTCRNLHIQIDIYFHHVDKYGCLRDTQCL